MSDDEILLGPGAEFDAIREVIQRLGDAAHGIGDDAAILEIARGERLVVSTDAAIENRHFRAEWLTAEEIGYRAVMAALSDLAAMAAHPLAILWTVNVPERWRPRLPALADGARDAARSAGAKIVGGNLAAAGELAIVTTVIGTAYRPLRRAGAIQGNKLYLTGRLGGPGLALAALSAGSTPLPPDRTRFARPVARIAEARWLADRRATAAIDLSDGLASDARHLAAASGVGLVVHLDRVPLVDGADAIAAARSGEEYELLVAAPPLETAEFERRFGIPLTRIGEVTNSAGVSFVDTGRAVQAPLGHDHFST